MTVATADVLHVEVAHRVATLTFNRPEKLNALSTELIQASILHLKAWALDPEVGAVIVTGAGRAFCAGGDVSQMASATGSTFEQRLDTLRAGQELSWLLYAIPKLTIAAVNGYAMGAGLGIALSCDLRIAAEGARFGTAYAQVGFGGDYGISWQLTRLLGPAKAKELFILGDVIDAAEALRIGLVNRLYPPETLLTEVRALAERVAAGPLVSFRYMKENVNLAMTSDFRSMLDREAMTHLRCGETEDHREGVAAFKEKRPPRFQGR